MKKQLAGATVLSVSLTALLGQAVPLLAQAITAPMVVPGTAVAVYRNDTAHTGYTTETLTPPLSLLWRHTATPVANSAGSPVSANGVVYFPSGGHVYAVRASDGQTLWQYPATDEITGTFSGTPALDNGFLYVGSDNTQLYKLSAKTGEQVWTKKVDGAIRSAITVESGIVYFGSADTHCYAANADTGDIVWSFTTNGPVTTAPTIAGSDVIFASADDSVYCVSKSRGTKVWSLELNGDPTTAPPVFASNIVYVGGGDTLYAISARSGETRWSQRLSAEITTQPTVGPGFVAVGTVDGGLFAFTPLGRIKWKRAMSYPITGSPLLAGGIFVVPQQRGAIYALQADTGKTVWQYVVPSSIAKRLARPGDTEVTASPIIVNDTLYILGNDGSLSALRSDAVDVLPPQIKTLSPEPGSAVAEAVYPTVTLSDDGSGIDPSSVSLLLDGKPLSHVIYDPNKGQILVDTSSPDAAGKPTLTMGTHQVVVKAADWRGNAVTRTWGFTVNSEADNGGNGNGGRFGGFGGGGGQYGGGGGQYGGGGGQYGGGGGFPPQ